MARSVLGQRIHLAAGGSNAYFFKRNGCSGRRRLVIVIGPEAATAQGAPPTLTKVVFSLDFIPLGRHAPWYAAIAEGFFKAEGLDVSIIPSQGGANVIQNVAAGTANLGFMGVPEVAIARSTGARLKMVAVNYQKQPIAVFSLQSGANVTTAKQLEGLTLGSGSGSFTPPRFCRASWLDRNWIRVHFTSPTSPRPRGPAL